jgi:hypothetical protein
VRDGHGAQKTLVSALGEASLTGVRAKVARPVAGAVSRRSRFSEEQVSAAIGLVFLALSVYGLVSTVQRALRSRAVQDAT